MKIHFYCMKPDQRILLCNKFHVTRQQFNIFRGSAELGIYCTPHLINQLMYPISSHVVLDLLHSGRGSCVFASRHAPCAMNPNRDRYSLHAVIQRPSVQCMCVCVCGWVGGRVCVGGGWSCVCVWSCVSVCNII